MTTAARPRAAQTGLVESSACRATTSRRRRRIAELEAQLAEELVIALKDEDAAAKRAKQERGAGVHRRARRELKRRRSCYSGEPREESLAQQTAGARGQHSRVCRVRPGSAAEREAGLVRTTLGSGAVDFLDDGQTVTVR